MLVSLLVVAWGLVMLWITWRTDLVERGVEVHRRMHLPTSVGLERGTATVFSIFFIVVGIIMTVAAA